jgi:hypothetical protein
MDKKLGRSHTSISDEIKIKKDDWLPDEVVGRR